MKWFTNFSKQNTLNDTDATLNKILANGVELSINELLQYQSKTSLISLKATKNLQNKMSGGYLARSKGRGMEFDEVRHYQTGDDIRAIDWRVTARTGKTHTKLFREEVERPVLVVTDLSHNMLFGSQLLFKSVQAAHLASLVAWHAKQRGDRIGGIVFNDDIHFEFKPRSRKEGVLHYLHGLVQAHEHSLSKLEIQNSTQNKASTFAENCSRLRQLAHPGSLVYLITDGQNISSESIRHLSHVSRHCELIVCQIIDPLEQHLPDSQQRLNVAVTDGMQRQQLSLGDKQFAKNYQQQALLLMKERKNLFSKAGARLLNISAGEALEDQLTNGENEWIR